MTPLQTIVAVATGVQRWGVICADNAEVLPLLGDKSVDHVITDPLELVEQFTDPGDLVLDPFCGSGTTGVACLRLGRRFLGVERDAKYAAVATERMAAEAQGLTLRDARAGQLSLLGAP